MIPDDFFIRELIEDEDIIFSKDSEYHKQKKKEKKNPIFKKNKPRNRWALWGGRRMIPKFRAWSKQYKKMIDEVNDMTFFEGNLEFIGCRTANGVSFQYCADDIILMQSTGLFDKNSKEIFEGDILGTKDGLLNGVVEYRADLGMFVNSLIRYNNFERLCNIGSDREIISNIYENPELLGG